MDVYYIDGSYVEDEKATLSVKDIAVLRGFGVFDFLITYNKRPFKLQAHVARLENSARKIGLTLQHTNTEICHIVEETVLRNRHHDESNIRIVYTGGISSDGVTPEGNGKLLVMVTPKHILPDWWTADGVKVITADIERFLPHAKSTSYLNAVYALQLAYQAGAIETVYVDRNQRVLEGTTSNIFFFKGNQLITPGSAILAGITRSVILDLANGHFELAVRDVDRAELGDMDEVFITASNKEVIPVVQLNDQVIRAGKPGENTRRVMRLFREYTTAYGRHEVD
jgi:branched-chain amino acid aminotransferase